MNIDKKLDGGKLSLKISGRLDTNTSPQLEAELKLDGVNEVSFDLTELEYVSSAGLRVFLTAQKAMNEQGFMTVLNPGELVREVFEVTGFNDILTVDYV